MKQLVLVLFLTVVLFACKGTNKETSKPEATVKAAATEVDPLTKKMDELKKLSPLSMDELKKLLPDTLLGIKRTNFSFNSAMGYSMAQGDYEKNNKTDIRMVVYDCAGQAGAEWYSMNYWTKSTMEAENENGYTKTIDFNGGKAIENYDKTINVTTFTYLANDRILVVLTGRNIKSDDLKNAAEKLNLKVS
ncbi:MAG TPA: hypothetical protein VNR87_06630 [Flavisolibacter sp.]|nr:hypothetical protein [Flavisolibacter sp.]